MVVVQRITADDWATWRELRLRALEEAPYAFTSTLAEWTGEADSEQRWRRRLEEIPVNVLALLRDEAVGMASVNDGAPGEAEVISMWVAPTARGKGVGEALLDRCVAEARGRGASHLCLDVLAANKHAVRLYRRVGFVDDGWARDAGDSKPALRLRRTLSDDDR